MTVDKAARVSGKVFFWTIMAGPYVAWKVLYFGAVCVGWALKFLLIAFMGVLYLWSR